MVNLHLTLEFDGTRYAGWQVQPGAVTVQEVLEQALRLVFKQEIALAFCGRTDAGVHARDFHVNFPLSQLKVPLDSVPKALNSNLPDDVAVLKAQLEPEIFDANASALCKTYRYHIVNQSFLPPLKRLYATMVSYPLDFDLLSQAAEMFLGEHSFKAFCTEPETRKHHMRRIESLSIERKGSDVFIEISASGFLYNMVRIIVGTLIDVARGRMPIEKIEQLFQSGDRREAGPTFPAKGLCLMNVRYV